MIGFFLESIFEWLLTSILGGVLSTVLGGMTTTGVTIFDQEPVRLILGGVYKIGFLLWGTGVVVAVFDMGIQYGRGRGTPQDLLLNFVRSYLGALLFTALPVPYYKALLNAGWAVGGAITGGNGPFDGLDLQNLLDITDMGLTLMFIFGLLFVIVLFLNYFEFIKRSFFLFYLTCVGCLYMVSVPRGYTDGFMGWCKQIIGLGFASFLQMVGLGLSLYFITNSQFLVGLAGMLGCLCVDRLLQSFGGASGQTNLSGVLHTGSYAVSTISRALVVKK